jgi:tRNA-dihydrouridine synthase A
MRMNESVPTNDSVRPDIRVAPMMDWTDRHCRYFHRLLSPSIGMTTEMIHAGAILFGDRDRFLRFDESEQPLALQLGGSDPDSLAKAAAIAAQWGYDEANINCGCPSERVQKGAFGACLMKEPALVSDCVKAMIDGVQNKIPVTVKCRIGVDDSDEDQFLTDFVGEVAEAGCAMFVVHARKAWLKGLSPKENREIPPLNYERVYRLKQQFPHLKILINGGIDTIEKIEETLAHTDGVMIGREAYQNPMFLNEIENHFYGPHAVDRDDIAEQMERYWERERKATGITMKKNVFRHMMGLYNNLPGARKWRQSLSDLRH